MNYPNHPLAPGLYLVKKASEDPFLEGKEIRVLSGIENPRGLASAQFYYLTEDNQLCFLSSAGLLLSFSSDLPLCHCRFKLEGDKFRVHIFGTPGRCVYTTALSVLAQQEVL